MPVQAHHLANCPQISILDKASSPHPFNMYGQMSHGFLRHRLFKLFSYTGTNPPRQLIRLRKLGPGILIHIQIGSPSRRRTTR